ncbi:uncharacterized protein FIBRA_04179 [Fibroporia radiculosa]|uniref:Uncharacterized protein n=1 Tax=Fibroporia radiculosa TaxID=599839 RepID=J4HWE1_9APHY|nr:uncharacterized protein FIBRA_04179 [Fibroporia radiculosa]CCM02102.1 predicted protein [Fibroporia radiculosa]
MAHPTVALIGTCDTKLEELLYVHDKLVNQHGMQCKLIDVGRTPSDHPSISIRQSDIFRLSGIPPVDLTALPRGEVISTLIKHTIPIVASMQESNAIHAALSLGGSGGSSLAAEVMRAALPLGFPKLIVSTMAAGDVRPYVGESDVTMMHSVVDIAGLNDILCAVLDNAAGAIAGMARAQHTRLVHATSPALSNSLSAPPSQDKRIAITMFGVTTPAVTHARALLAAYPCTTYIFHATGAGGRALERLAAAHYWDGVLDLTTTELADALLGGVLSAGDMRLTSVGAARVPQIVSLGALDMVNFGPRETVPGKYHGRNLHMHNPSITLMRTSPEDCATLGQQVAERLAGADPDLTEVWVPVRGVSALSVCGQQFHDPEADRALFSAVKAGLGGTGIRVREEDHDINDPAFVQGMVQRLVEMMGLEPVRDEV